MSLKGLLTGAAIILACSAVLPEPAFAEGEGLAAKFAERKLQKKKGNGFFDLFGQPRRRGNIAIVEGPRKSKRKIAKAAKPAKPKVFVPVETVDYTPAPSNYHALVYQPEKLVPLSGGAFAGTAPADPLAAAIHAELGDRQQRVHATETERTAVLAAYEASGFKPLWVTAEGLTPRGRAVLALLSGAGQDGLEAADYLPPALGSFTDPEALHRGDLIHQARLDLGLTAAALAYARHMSAGRILPDRLTTYNDINPKAVEPAMAMRVLGFSPAPETWLASLAPKHPAYRAFKAALTEARKSFDGVEEPAIPAGRKIKPGQTDQRIGQVRSRLTRLGIYQTDRRHQQIPVTDGNQYDRLLVLAVKAFQEKSGLKATGTIDAAAIRALNDRGDRDNYMRLVFNMDRLRWLPDDLGRRHVFVNQADFRLRVQDGAKTVWETNVVVGKANTQTVAFHDQMETVVFNPTWGVPQSIMANEMLPRLRREPGFLDRQGFQVVNSKGKVVKSSSVRWSSYGDKVPYSFIQPPGRGNALGEIKFLFPNKHDIYMHDTPSKSLFAQSVRAFSHGCIRVENPRGFAEIITGLNQAEIAANIAAKKTYNMKLTQKVPVHVTYFTAWPDADGRIEYFNDIYGRDALMEKALTAKTMARVEYGGN